MVERRKPLRLHRLDRKQVFALLQYMNEKYVASGLHDEQFALVASAELKMTVTEHSVAGVRQAAGIAPNPRPRMPRPPSERKPRPSKSDHMLKLIDLLTEDLRKLERRHHFFFQAMCIQRPGLPAEVARLEKIERDNAERTPVEH